MQKTPTHAPQPKTCSSASPALDVEELTEVTVKSSDKVVTAEVRLT